MVERRTVRSSLEASRLPTGFTALQALLDLEARTRDHQWRLVRFIVDPGSNITTLSVSTAKENEIAFPAKAFSLRVNTSAGRVRQRLHAGKIVVRISGLEGRNFIWPCHFVDDEGMDLKSTLGLAGILDDLRLIFDGSYSLESPYGCLILEEVAERKAP